MALTSEISATTQKYFVPKMVDNIFNSNALFQRGRKKFYDSVDGGTDIQVPLLYATTTASGWYSGEETLNTTANDQETAASFDWKQLYANITIKRLDELKNSGAAQVIDHVKVKVQSAEKTMKDTFGTALFNDGTTSNALVGLRSVVGSSRAYGTIDSSSNSWWDAQVDSSTTALTMGAMQSLYGDCTIDNDKPSVVISTQDQFDNYYSLLQPQQRFQDDDTAKGGFMNLMFNGIPFIVDSHCPSGYLFMLNENYLSIKYHPKENFRFEPFIKPVNQNISLAKIYWAGAFTCSNPRMQGVMSALT